MDDSTMLPDALNWATNVIATEAIVSNFPFFPIPAEGKSIYSVFCRCAERSGLPAQYILSELTGQKYKTALLASCQATFKSCR
jgi:hypothetical protein